MNADAKGEARTPEILYEQKTSWVKMHWISSAPSASSADRASFEIGPHDVSPEEARLSP